MMPRPLASPRWGIAEHPEILGVVLGLAYWVVESAIDSFVFHQGGFLDQLLAPSGHELWMRLTLVALLVGLGKWSEQLVDGRRKAEAGLEAACDWLEHAVRERTQELSRSERTLQTLVSSARDVICSLSPSGTIRNLNPAFETITGWSCCEWEGQTLLPLLHPADVPLAKSMLGKLLAGEQPLLFELRIRHKSGDFVTTELTTAVEMSGGRVISILCIARDVTDRKRFDSRIAQSQKMEAVGRLSAAIAHDFNNLLMVIESFTDLAMSELPEGAPQRPMLDEIHKATERATALTCQLLTFSRQNAVRPVDLNLTDVLIDVDSMLRRLLRADVKLGLTCAPDLPTVKADRGQLQQVIVNLAVNACDAMPDGGRLEITTSRVELREGYVFEHPGAIAGSYVLMEVSDTGRGMDQETLGHIFDPFFTTKPEGQGTGLGLAIVYSIVQQSGGHVDVISVPNQGTSFRVYLPCRHEAVGTSARDGMTQLGRAKA